jgi:hypothetical protein
VCLTDFGLAKDFGYGLNDQAEEDAARASTICGTQEYMVRQTKFLSLWIKAIAAANSFAC